MWSSYYIWSQILKVVGFCWKLGKWGKFMLDLNWKKKIKKIILTWRSLAISVIALTNPEGARRGESASKTFILFFALLCTEGNYGYQGQRLLESMKAGEQDWRYGLSSFQARDKKLVRFLTKINTLIGNCCILRILLYATLYCSFHYENKSTKFV